MKERQEFLRNVEEKLLKKKEEVAEQLSMQSNDKIFEGEVKDSGDEALETSLDKLQSSLQQAEIDELNLIDEALARIKKGEYGICIDCSEQIPPQRLDHYPYAARCIPCQKELEK
jgi:DnaK suppressor protein